MKRVSSYLSFTGNCREAMNFYRDCFGGDVTFLTVGESPVACEMPEFSGDAIMHACLEAPGFALMGSDMRKPDAQDGCGQVSVILDCSSNEEITQLFTKLGAGGTEICPLGPAFWGGNFGAVRDRFGIRWMMNQGD